jgi:hypothetical protein
MKIDQLLRPAFLLLLLTLQIGAGWAGQDREAFKRISDEGRRSELMKNLELLTDTIGPRLTGSNNYDRAAQWLAASMREYGLEGVRLEGFRFGRGWRRGAAYGRMVAPYELQLSFCAVAWTPGTKGRIVAPVVAVSVSSWAELDKYAQKVKGSFILLNPPARVRSGLNPRPLRMSDDGFKLSELPFPWPPPPSVYSEYRFRMYEFPEEVAEFAKRAGAAGIITDSGRGDGLLDSRFYAPGRDPGKPETIPIITMSHEHYGTLSRLVNRGLGVRLEMDIRNYFEQGDLNTHNIVGEIRGSQMPEEMVLLGAHLDSWDLGAGAVDNGAGAMAVLEAARLLKAIDAKPRRAIRFVFFAGEEQGNLGSLAYIAAHSTEMSRVSAAFIIDNGTGRIRGVGVEGNRRAVPILRKIIEPLSDAGVIYINEFSFPISDHASFEKVGVPGFIFIQDPIQYVEKTHHSQIDALDKVLPDDLEQCASVMAHIILQVANLPELLPRKE